jgi:hypothetical protein
MHQPGGFMQWHRYGSLALALTGTLTIASGAAAQERRMWIFLPPSFSLQPGLVTRNFVDTPAGTSATTDFNMRFATLIPFTAKQFGLLAIVQWTPWAESRQPNGVMRTNNTPSLVVGPVYHVYNGKNVSFDVDVFDAYTPAARGENAAYTHKLQLQGDVNLKLGEILLPAENRAYAKRISLYGKLAYLATGIPSTASPWVALYGLTLPLSP